MTSTSTRGPQGPVRSRIGARSARAMLALVVAAMVLVPATHSSAAPTSVDLKLLVIAADGTETDLPAITTFLTQTGVPYDTVIASQQTLTADMLSDTPGHGRYEGIVLTTGNLTYFNNQTASWQSALTTDQWNMLHAYQAQFGVRSVTSYTFPEATYGLSYTSYQDTLATPLNGTLTAAGQSVFSNVNPTAQIPFKGAWVYLGNVIDPSVTTPLITADVGGQTYPIASVTKYPAGYENLAITAANNPNLVHSLLLSTGWIRWVTKGVYLGVRHANLDLQLDDLFLTDGEWDPATHAATSRYRNTAADISALASYQNARKADPLTPGFKVELAFNGVGANINLFQSDGLTNAVRSNRSQFGFINHTYDHYNLDCGSCLASSDVVTSTASKIQSEITSNILVGTLLGLSSNWDTMVQPSISGIDTPPNPMAQKAAADAGVRFWIGDTSRPSVGNPTFNTGFATPGDTRIYVVPRHPTNLFYSVTTPAEWTDVYNYLYAPGGQLCAITACFGAPQTYDQILDHESDYLLRYLLQGDLDPMMFHVPNLKAYSGTRSVFTDLIDVTLNRYRALTKTPIRTLSFKQAGTAMQDRAAYNASGVTSTLVACTSLTLKVTKAATIPVSGVSYRASNSTVETYDGKVVSSIKLAAGQSVTIPLPAC